jgi:hypothetical protein
VYLSLYRKSGAQRVSGQLIAAASWTLSSGIFRHYEQCPVIGRFLELPVAPVLVPALAQPCPHAWRAHRVGLNIEKLSRTAKG